MSWIAVGVGSAAYLGGKAIGSGGGSGGSGLGKDENLRLLGNKVQLSDIGVSAAKDLQKYYETGTMPGTKFTVGEKYPGKLGEYELSPLEGKSSLAINNLIQSGAPELNRLAGKEFNDLLATDQYNPISNKDTYFKPYKAEIDFQYGEASDALDRELAATGDFYSTNRSNQQRELAETQGRQTSMLLSDLYQDYMNKRLQGAAIAADMGNQQQIMEMQRIEAAQKQGALERILKDAQAKEAYNAWLRERSEYGDIINTAKTLYSGTPTTSTFDSASSGSTYTGPSFWDKFAPQLGQDVTKFGQGMLGSAI